MAIGSRVYIPFLFFHSLPERLQGFDFIFYQEYSHVRSVAARKQKYPTFVQISALISV
jgi:hypothetical protein